MAWDQTFDEEIADFDAVSPAWDNTCDAVADFDSETDADGDLNDAEAAAHDGAVGLEITFDNSEGAFGVLNAAAIDQTSGVISFWLDPNTVGLESTKYISIMSPRDGTASTHWQMLLYNDGGQYSLSIWDRDDAGTGTFSAKSNIIDAYHHVMFMFKRSSGAGANNGFYYVYVDGVLAISKTGIDNDTRDWDTCRFGMGATNSTTFSGSFYMDTIKIDPVGAPFVDTTAATGVVYGLAIPIMDATARYGSFTGPVADTNTTVECQLDPNTLTMATNDQFALIQCNGEFTVEVKYTGSAYQIQLALTTDGGTDATSWYTITDAYHKIRAVWKASSGAGKNDGYAQLYVDDVLQEQILSLDTDTLAVDEANFGAITGLDAGTYGIFYLDNCQWNDSLQTSAQAGAITPSGTTTKKTSDSHAGAITPSGAVAKKAKIAGLAGAITFAGTIVKKAKKALAGAITPTGAITYYKLWILFARFHDYFMTAPQKFTISSNNAQLTARYRDYYFTAPEKRG